ncbi:hypothetical protein [Shinella sp. M27]|uniref:hypothetical protein n=1 Tax=Shinella sp. M27 TaxID=3368614 RepID=UPI003B9FDB03
MLYIPKSLVAIIAIGLTLTCSSAHAADSYFTIRSADGSKTVEITAEAIEKAGSVTFKTTLPGTDGEELHEVRGPLMQSLLEQAGLEAEEYTAVALDNYEIDVPAEDFKTHGAIAAVEVDGKPLTVRDKGPAWIVYPRSDNPDLTDPIYESRSVWQLKELVAK